jgi:hypothetical protein
LVIEDLIRNGIPTAALTEVNIDWQGLDGETEEATLALLVGVTVKRLWDSGSLAALTRAVCADLIAAGAQRRALQQLDQPATTQPIPHCTAPDGVVHLGTETPPDQPSA